MPTYTCPAECTDCASLSSPRERSRLELGVILDSIREAKALGFGNVVFTGGEATLRWRDLVRAIRLATELDLPTRIVSNAHWARSPAVADRKLGELIDAGLAEINYSTGDEHVRFIPLERVIIAIDTTLRRALPLVVMVEMRAQRGITRKSIEDHALLAALTEDQRKGLQIIESPWMPLDPSVTEEYPSGYAADRENVGARTGCDNVLQTYVVQADGRVGSCCGIGMRLIPELNVTTVEEAGFLERAISEAESDFLKLWIHCDGPEKILAWAATKDPTIDWEGRYAHHCQACARVYRDPAIGRVIRDHYEEMITHVLQSIWIDDHLAPDLVRAARELHAEQVTPTTT